MYRSLDVPDLRSFWTEHKADILRQRGWTADSFEARQFEKNVLSGAMLGFSASPNTYAAATVLLLVVTMGMVMDRRNAGWSAAGMALLALAAGAWVLWWTASKAAAVSPLVAVGLLAAAWRWRGWLGNHHQRAFFIAAGVLVAGMLAVVGHAMTWGNLISSSLTFRWHYWVGAARMLTRHPLRGVGWDNFGLYYLQVRLPQASEEVRDPHNFIVRFWAELGAVGGVLLLAWMLRMWWEMTRPNKIDSHAAHDVPRHGPARLLAMVAGLGIALNVAASVDFNTNAAYVTLELLKRSFYLGLLILGALLASGRLTDKPGPWLLRAVIVALGVFFIHSLIDFAWFETGPMCLVALLAGSVLGMRRVGATGHAALDHGRRVAGGHGGLDCSSSKNNRSDRASRKPGLSGQRPDPAGTTAAGGGHARRGVADLAGQRGLSDALGTGSDPGQRFVAGNSSPPGGGHSG